MAELAPPEVAQCVEQAIAYYRADGARVVAALQSTNGKHGQIRVLPNGEVEVGISAIPGKEIAALAKNGITAQALADDDCLNVHIKTYLVQRDLALNSGPGVGAPADADAALQALTAQFAGLPRKGAVVPDRCVVAAADRYAIPVTLFQAVLKTEGGWVGLKKRNSNGSYDMGPGQINDIHLPELKKYGITAEHLINDACTNVHVAAFRLRSEINRAGEMWRGVGNYHSRTPHLNLAYQVRVRQNLSKILSGSK